MANWDDERCLQLIEAYRKTPMLWDQKNKYYYKKNMKEDAWTNIGAVMGCNGETCKQKMISILASYRREKMKIRKTSGPGKSIDDMYESKWYAFNALEFLSDRNKPKTSAVQENTINETSSDENIVFTITEPPSKKTKPDPKLDILKDAFGILEKAAEKPPQRDHSAELKAFFDFIMEKMKNYNTETKNSVQQEIFQIIVRADQGYYDYPQQHVSTVTSSVTVTTPSSPAQLQEYIKCEEV